jgi:hypothetical protein
MCHHRHLGVPVRSMRFHTFDEQMFGKSVGNCSDSACRRENVQLNPGFLEQNEIGSIRVRRQRPAWR